MPNALVGKFEGMDLTSPEIDMVKLAESLGVEAVRIEEPHALAEELKKSLAASRPRLIDVPISRTVPPRLNYG